MAGLSYISNPQCHPFVYKSIIDVFNEKADELPDKEICIHRLPDGSRRAVTYAILRSKAEKVAKFLVSMGVKVGNSVGILGPNSIEWIVGELAILMTGAVSVHLSKPCGSTKEIYQLLQTSDCMAVLLDPDGDEGLLNDLILLQKQETPSTKVPVGFEESGEPFVVMLKKYSGVDMPDVETIGNEIAARNAVLPKQICPETVAIVFMTSGSTGHPKMVEHSHFGLVNTSSSTMFSRGLDIVAGCGAMYNDRPFAWIGGTCIYNLIHGDTRVFRDGRLSLKETGVIGLWQNIVEEKCTYALLLPFTLLDLLANEQEIMKSNHCLNTIVTGGQIVASQIADVCGKFCDSLVIGYGSTELSIVTCTYMTNKTDVGEVGSLFDGVELKVIDEDFYVVPRGKIGEIYVKCPWMLKGYRNATKLQQMSFTDGWMKTGDIGVMKMDGNLFIKGKEESVIKRLTRKVMSGDVEECIAEIPEVKKVSVVAIPDQRLYEDVCACVVLDQNTYVTMTDVELHCRQRLGDNITGDAPTYYLQFESIPVLSSGKPDKNKVKEDALKMLCL
ncbi:putative acyl--CoA ligase YdaB [Ylistrum balloti]|uniref:putative acyl--CoA ligase YdaB n=1 Tax=Ylistrum balloti TaxID=509963 RepID=UPI002905B207|nr:putative acyl--CoA ligase YdaB [Ylistrum balloti]